MTADKQLFELPTQRGSFKGEKSPPAMVVVRFTSRWIGRAIRRVSQVVIAKATMVRVGLAQLDVTKLPAPASQRFG